MSVTPGRPRFRLRWLIGGVVLVVVGCLALAGFGLWQLGGFELGTTVEDQLSRADVERLMAAKLPASASGIHSYYTGFQDYYALVRFEMPAADAAQFLASTAFTQTLSTTDNPFAPALSDLPWWRPYEAQSFQWGGMMENSQSQTLLIDMTDPQRYVVYWRGYGT